MSFDYGPLCTYEITWKTGHVETVQGHQVTFDSARPSFSTPAAGLLGTAAETRDLPPRFYIHGQFDGHWRMVLTAPEADLVSIRDVTSREVLPGEVQA